MNCHFCLHCWTSALPVLETEGKTANLNISWISPLLVSKFVILIFRVQFCILVTFNLFLFWHVIHALSVSNMTAGKWNTLQMWRGNWSWNWWKPHYNTWPFPIMKYNFYNQRCYCQWSTILCQAKLFNFLSFRIVHPL